MLTNLIKKIIFQGWINMNICFAHNFIVSLEQKINIGAFCSELKIILTTQLDDCRRENHSPTWTRTAPRGLARPHVASHSPTWPRATTRVASASWEGRGGPRPTLPAGRRPEHSSMVVRVHCWVWLKQHLGLVVNLGLASWASGQGTPSWAFGLSL